MEEKENIIGDASNSEIAYISVKVNSTNATAMVDTGANVSLIDKMELDRIQSENKATIPTLPINNIILIGATGRQNKTIRQQVQLDVSSNGKTIPMVFLVASGLPFTLLIGCDILRKYTAIINMDANTVVMKAEEVEWTANLTEYRKAPSEHVIYYIREGHEHHESAINQELHS